MLAEATIRRRKTRSLRRVAQLTRAQLEAEKLAESRRLVRHAHAHSPYYGRIIAERGIDIASCTPLDFPALTKTLLMRHFDEIVTAPGVTKSAIAEFLTRSHNPAERFLGRYRVIHTSGSSGEVGYFVYSSRDWARGNVTTAGEATSAADRALLGQTFGCDVVNSYGCSEHLGMGASLKFWRANEWTTFASTSCRPTICP